MKSVNIDVCFKNNRLVFNLPINPIVSQRLDDLAHSLFVTTEQIETTLWNQWWKERWGK